MHLLQIKYVDGIVIWLSSLNIARRCIEYLSDIQYPFLCFHVMIWKIIICWTEEDLKTIFICLWYHVLAVTSVDIAARFALNFMSLIIYCLKWFIITTLYHKLSKPHIIYSKNVIESSPKKFLLKKVLRASGAKYRSIRIYELYMMVLLRMLNADGNIYENRDLRVSAKIPGQIFFGCNIYPINVTM